MSAYLYSALTNEAEDSRYDVLGHLMPARMFFFVVVDEIGKDGFLVRNCYASVENPWLKALNLGRLGEIREIYPERLGLWGKGPDSAATIAEHVMGEARLPASFPLAAISHMARAALKARRSTSTLPLPNDPERELLPRLRSG